MYHYNYLIIIGNVIIINNVAKGAEFHNIIP